MEGAILREGRPL